MRDLVEVIVFGLQFGSIYSLVGLGIALVYKATRILNFAQGELATAPAWVSWLILVGWTTSDAASPDTGFAMLLIVTIVAVVVGAGLGVLLNVVVVRRLANVSPVTSLVATIGVFLLFASVQIIVFEAKARSFPRYVQGGFDLPLIDVQVLWHTVITLAVLGLAAGVLAAFFKTPQGVALLATAQEPFAAELQGVRVERMRTLAWGAAGALGGLAGILGAGFFESISPGFMTTTFLVPALTGVVLGGITSMVGAVAGNFVLGIVAAAATEIDSTFELGIPGPPVVAIFVVLLGVLLLRPRGLLGKEA